MEQIVAILGARRARARVPASTLRAHEHADRFRERRAAAHVDGHQPASPPRAPRGADSSAALSTRSSSRLRGSSARGLRPRLPCVGSGSEPLSVAASEPRTVLVLPAWYPTARQPLLGPYVRDHARAAAEFGHRMVIVVDEGPERQRPRPLLARRVAGRAAADNSSLVPPARRDARVPARRAPRRAAPRARGHAGRRAPRARAPDGLACGACRRAAPPACRHHGALERMAAADDDARGPPQGPDRLPRARRSSAP